MTLRVYYMQRVYHKQTYPKLTPLEGPEPEARARREENKNQTSKLTNPFSFFHLAFLKSCVVEKILVVSAL